MVDARTLINTIAKYNESGVHHLGLGKTDFERVKKELKTRCFVEGYTHDISEHYIMIGKVKVMA